MQASVDTSVEDLYAESVRRYTARQRDKNRWAWVRYFDRMAANHSALAESYRERAERLCGIAPLDRGEGGS